MDAEEQTVRFLEVRAVGTLGLSKKHFLVPYEAVPGVSDDRVTLDQDPDRVTNTPELDGEICPNRHY